MKDAFAMWRSTKMAVLTALCAAVYAALIIPLKPIPIIPGFTEIRPATVIPIVGGLLFGPAAAWGCAFGTVISDFLGTIGPGSLFGFVGNFVFAYVPYRLWRMLRPRQRPTGEAAQAWLYILLAILASMCCGVVIGWGVDLLGMVPYPVLASIITLNNSVAGVALGLILLPLVYPRARRWGLLYDDIMAEEDYKAGALAPVGAVAIVLGAVGGTLFALNLFLGGAGGALVPGLAAILPLKTASSVCALLILVGCATLARRPTGERTLPVELAQLEIPQGVTAIELEDVSFAYALGKGLALTGISLRQQPGEFRVVMGRTGSGKSTLCKALNNVVPRLQAGHFTGTVRLFGHEVGALAVHALAPLIGQVFQDFESQLLTSSVEREVAFPLENLGVPEQEMETRVRQALEQVEMWEARGRDPVLLSGGQKQRVALAAALVTAPPIIVLDEPTTDLDPQGKQELLQQCRELRARGKTVLVAEHETALAAEADLLTVLDHGTVAYDGPPEALLADPERCQRLGVRPLDMPALFAALGRPERPLTVDEGAQLLSGYAFDETAWQRLTAAEDEEGEARRLDEEGTPLLAVKGVGYTYPGPVQALECVSLEIQSGEFVAILGPNGSGKTTLSKLLNGLLLPSRGQVLVEGVDTRHTTPGRLAGTIGYLFQDPDHQIFAETVFEEVAFGLRNAGVSGEKLTVRVRRALEAVGLEAAESADPFALTPGERQMVALASILAMRPQVIVFDEPTTGLDGVQQRAMMERLRALNEDGHTVIIITHCAWAAAEYARRALVMVDGDIIADAPTRAVFAEAGLLARAHLRVPQVTELCQRLWGKTVLTVDEAVTCLRGGEGS